MTQLIGQLTAAGLRRTRAASWAQEDQFAAVLAVLARDYPAGRDDAGSDVGGHAHVGDPAIAAESGDEVGLSPLDDIAGIFGLDRVEMDVLWSIAAADLEPNVAHAYAALRGSPSSTRPTVGLALELAGIATTDPASFSVLSATGNLRRHRLVAVMGDEPWLLRPVLIPDPVLATLAGAFPDDPVIRGMIVPVSPVQLPGVGDIQRSIENGQGLVWVNSSAGMPGASLAAAGIRATGLDYLCVDARRVRAGEACAEAMASAAREAGLLARALIVLGGEALADSADHGAIRPLGDAAVPVVVVSSRTWDSSWLPTFPLIVDAPPLTASDRSAIWLGHMDASLATDEDLTRTLSGLRLTPEAVRETVRYARKLAAASGRTVDAAAVKEAARRVGGARGASTPSAPLARVDGGGPTFDDLILPDAVAADIHRLAAWGRHRNEVTAHGPLNRRGIAALFAGGPGTGKTLAAHVLAEELALDLLQVDVATVVDKYIGETEKNLEKIFLAAEALDVVLFFDEADALFGSRSEVKNAHDRYANQEIAYLLQRMEQFDGITLLATNLRGNLDPAFSRRMSFIVHFPDPDPPTRRRLWVSHLAQLAATDLHDPIHVDRLAVQVEASGGDIRNIVRAAAYDAAATGEVVGMRHILGATVHEFRKLGKLVPSSAEWRALSAPMLDSA